jgi:hypothetical protein
MRVGRREGEEYNEENKKKQVTNILPWEETLGMAPIWQPFRETYHPRPNGFLLRTHVRQDNLHIDCFFL